MWLILPPSTSSPSAPASADSTSELSLPQAERLASSAGLSGTPRPAKSWRRAWRTRASLRTLSGATCEPSMADAGADAWISSLRGIRASRSATPVDAVERTILGIYGRTSLASLARLNPASSFSRTSEDTSLSASMLYAPICEPSATELRRDCSRRQRLARHTGESGCSSSACERWPTPDAQVMNDGAEAQSHAARLQRMKDLHQNGNGAGMTLGAAVSQWPTPNRADSQTSPDYPHKGGNPTLVMAADQWSTPQTPGGGAKSRSGERLDELLLSGQAEACLSGLQVPATSRNGGASSASAPTSRPRLNPAFVEWLMGWPEGWTDFASAATAWSLWKRRMRSSLYGLVCRGTSE